MMIPPPRVLTPANPCIVANDLLLPLTTTLYDVIVVDQTTFGAKEDARVVRKGGMASMSPIPCL